MKHTKTKKTLAIFICLTITLFAACFAAGCEGRAYTLRFYPDELGIAAITAKAGEAIVPPVDPVKDGYVFMGWYTSEDFSGEAVNLPTVMPEKNMSFYAKFEENGMATINVDMGGVGEDKQFSLPIGTPVLAYLRENVNTSSDKATFDGFFVGSVALKDTARLTGKGLKVKAEWLVDCSLEVYRENLAGEFVKGETVNLSARLGSTLFVSENYGGTGYTPDENFVAPTLVLGENKVRIDYYLNRYIVRYVFDEKDKEGGARDVTIKHGETYAIEACSYEKPDRRFLGWSDKAGGGVSPRYAVGQRSIPNDNLFLYAVWQYAYTSGDDVIFYSPHSSVVTLVKNGKEYVSEVLSSSEFVFDVDGTKVYAKIENVEKFEFRYRDELYGTYVYKDYVTGEYFKNRLMQIDGYGYASINAVDISGGITAERFGKYSLTEKNDYSFIYYDPVTGLPLIDSSGNDIGCYFTLEEYTAVENITGAFMVQGYESGSFMGYSNGELLSEKLLLNGYGYARLYSLDPASGVSSLVAEGRYSGTDDYAGYYGEWRFSSSLLTFKFILNTLTVNNRTYLVFTEFSSELYGEYKNGSSSLYLDGYGSAAYTLAGGQTLTGLVTRTGDTVIFRPYSESGVTGSATYFNLDTANKTFTLNDTGFIITGGALTKYDGTSSVVEIPETVTEISENAFHYLYLKENVTIISATIPASVKKIGARAFENNSTLRRIYMLSSTPCELGEKAFDWPGGDFCIIVPDEAVSAYRAAAGWNAYAKYIFGENEIANKPEFEVENGVLVRYNKKSDGDTVTIPAEVKEIAAKVFKGVSGIKTIDLNNVEKVGEEAFAYCADLTTLVSEKLKETGAGAFMECTSLAVVNLPAIKLIGASSFSGCMSLSTVTLGENLEEIKEKAFSECAYRYAVENGTATVTPFDLQIVLEGVNAPKMGEKVFYGGTQARIKVKDISVVLACYNSPSWKNYATYLIIDSGSEAGVYYDNQNLLTLVINGRMIVFGMYIWQYSIDGENVRIYAFDKEEATYYVVDGTIKDGVISLGSGEKRNVFVKDGKTVTYTSLEGDKLSVLLKGGTQNTFSITYEATFNNEKVSLYVDNRNIYFEKDGYRYFVTLTADYGFSFTKSLIAYTVKYTAADGSELNVKYADTPTVTGTLKNVGGEERVSTTEGSWTIAFVGEAEAEITVIWRTDTYLVKVTFVGETFTYTSTLKERNVNLIDYTESGEKTNYRVLITLDGEGKVIKMVLRINNENNVPDDISSTPEKEGDGYLFTVSDENSPYYGKYHVKIDIEAQRCSVTQEKIK